MRIIFILQRFNVILVLGGLAGAVLPAVAQEEATAGRRVADVASIAVSEYAEGVVGRRIVLEQEYAEAGMFLAEARRTAGTLPAGIRDAALARIENLISLHQQVAEVSDLAGELAGLRTNLEQALGVPLDPLPESPPSLTVGRRVFEQACARCHGASGRGDGPSAEGKDPPPGNLADAAALGAATPVEWFRKVNVGVAGTDMPEFGEALSAEERWSVVLYASSLRNSTKLALGKALIEERCTECVLSLGDLAVTARTSDDSLRSVLVGIGPEWGADSLEAVVAFARVAAAAEYWGGDRVLAIRRTVARAKAGVERAATLALRGDREEARIAVLDAYLVFEGIESASRAQNARVVRRVEGAFADLRLTLTSAEPEEIASARAGVIGALDAVSVGASRVAGPQAFFFQSFVILVREGLEAILIVGALVAFLVRSGAPERRRDIGQGVLWALMASAAVAVGFATVFRAAAAHKEVLEAVTMLLAAGVLFVVSYWLVSKIEVQRWNAFVRARMSSALTSGRAWALAGVAFLAVFREGFETVLFYAALLATSDGHASAVVAVTAGFVTGAAVLGIVYVGIQRYGLRIPLRLFFGVTSALLYLMAFSFAGQGIAELQAVGWVGMTPLRWIPAVPALGIFPTMQTLLGQSFLAAALAVALIWVFWASPKTAKVRVSA